MNISFSIIIPVFNAKDYLVNCISSLKKQSYDNFEVIIIDDGSTDGSSELCDKLPLMFSDFPIKVVHQVNLGQIAARYRGILEATGDYCMFLDADDFYRHDTLEIVNKYIHNTSADIIIFDVMAFQEGIEAYPYWPKYSERDLLISGELMKKFKKDVIETTRFNNIWSKAFKRDILVKSHKYQNVNYIRLEEDYLMQLPFFDLAKCIMYTPQNLYYYRNNQSSITHLVFKPNCFQTGKFIFQEKMKYGAKWSVKNYETTCNHYFMGKTGSSIRMLKHANHVLNYKEEIMYLNKIRTDHVFRQQYKIFDGNIPSHVGRLVLWLLYHGMVHLTLMMCKLDPDIRKKEYKKFIGK